MGLLVEHGRADVGHLVPAQLPDDGQRVARVGDVVADQDLGVAQVDQVERRREQDGELQALVDPRVVLDVDDVDVLDLERVRDRPADQQPAPGDGQEDVRPKLVLGHHSRELPGSLPERLPGQDLPDDLSRACHPYPKFQVPVSGPDPPSRAISRVCRPADSGTSKVRYPPVEAPGSSETFRRSGSGPPPTGE